MSSSSSSTQKLRRNGSPSTNKSSGPLRATIPVSLMSQIHDVPEDSSSSSQNVWNKINAPHSGASTLLQCGVPKQSPWRLRQWSPTPKGLYVFTIVMIKTKVMFYLQKIMKSRKGLITLQPP